MFRNVNNYNPEACCIKRVSPSVAAAQPMLSFSAMGIQTLFSFLLEREKSSIGKKRLSHFPAHLFDLRILQETDFGKYISSSKG